MKFKIQTNKRTGQKTIILPKKKLNGLKDNPKFIEVKKMRFIK